MRVLSVFFHGLHGRPPLRAGRLAYGNERGYFEYDGAFLEGGVNLSPVHLRWEPGLQKGPADPFSGLHGIFNDSLPDGWGLLLIDRGIRAAGRDPRSLTPIDRLAFIGNRAMGALSYEPDEEVEQETAAADSLNLSEAGSEATRIFEGSLDEVVEYHIVHGSPSGGARPKILIGLSHDGTLAVTGAEDLPLDYRHWIAKFPTGQSVEQRAAGKIEYLYHVMARDAGIEMAPCKLFHADDDNAYFLTQRFDRLKGNQRVHVHTVAGLIHANFRQADFEYLELMKLTAGLTRSYAEKLQLFKRMVFNVICGNRDDHTKNFSFLLNRDKEWVNSPAYDLTFSTGMAGQHSMMISGKGTGINEEDLLAVAQAGTISTVQARRAIAEVADSVSCWPQHAKEFDLPRGLSGEIQHYIEQRLSAVSRTPGSAPAPAEGSAGPTMGT